MKKTGRGQARGKKVTGNALRDLPPRKKAGQVKGGFLGNLIKKAGSAVGRFTPTPTGS